MSPLSNYTIIKTYPSKSTPGKEYTAKVNNVTGLLSCDCRGTMKREGKPRFCDHCKDLAGEYGLLLEERDGQMFVVNNSGKEVMPNAARHRSRESADMTAGARRPVEAPAQFIQPMLASSMPAGWSGSP